MTRRWVYFVYGTLLLSCLSTMGAEIAPHLIESFLKRESINNHFEVSGATSEVQDRYRTGADPFSLPYVKVPKNDVVIVDRGLGNSYVRSLVAENSDWIQLPVHPESFELYAPLIEKYGLETGPFAQATASTRSLIYTELGVGVKTSLAKKQFGLGRVVPDWEIRRSVMISKMASRTPQKEWLDHGVSVIPDVLGIHVKPHLGLTATIDENQPLVLEHGVLYRDLGFLNQLPQFPKFPLFALFSPEGQSEPILINKWRLSGQSFYDFIEAAVLEPLIKSSAYLIFYQGIVPEMHGQNVIVALNPTDGHIRHVFHRDTGSMKVDFRQRLARGLSVQDLRSYDTATDFKFWRATAIAGAPIYNWFYSYMFTSFRGMEAFLKTYIPDYNPDLIRQRVDKLVERELNHYFPESQIHYRHAINPSDITRRIETSFAMKNPSIEIKRSHFLEADVLKFLIHQARFKEVYPFPAHWVNLQGRSWVETKFGILFDPGIVGMQGRVLFAPFTTHENPISVADHPRHFTTSATTTHIYSSKLRQVDPVALSDYLKDLVIPGNGDMPKVARLKLNDKYVYKILSGHQWALYYALIEKRKLMDLQVVVDLSVLDETQQLEWLADSDALAPSSLPLKTVTPNPTSRTWTKGIPAACAWLLQTVGLK